MSLAESTIEKARDLNPRHARFVAEYALSGNGTRSYKAVYGEGLSDGVAGAAASRLLTSDRIRAAVDSIKAQAAEAAEVTVERVLRELAIVALMPVEVALAIPHLLSGKLRCLELLMRHLGMFERRGEENGRDIGEELRMALERVRRHEQAEAAKNGAARPTSAASV